MHQARTGCNVVKSSGTNAPSNWFVFLCPSTHASTQTCHYSASSILAVPISCHVIAVFVFRKQRRMEKSVNTHNGLRYFLTNKIFLLQVMYRYVHMIFIVKCVAIVLLSLLMQRFDGKAWFLLFCRPLKLYMILYCTGTVFCHCSIVSWGLG